MKFIEIDYPGLVSDPPSVLLRLAQFLGTEHLPNEAAMAAVIDPSLHHQKAKV
jgi:hypothetical protein